MWGPDKKPFLLMSAVVHLDCWDNSSSLKLRNKIKEQERAEDQENLWMIIRKKRSRDWKHCFDDVICIAWNGLLNDIKKMKCNLLDVIASKRLSVRSVGTLRQSWCLFEVGSLRFKGVLHFVRFNPAIRMHYLRYLLLCSQCLHQRSKFRMEHSAHDH